MTERDHLLKELRRKWRVFRRYIVILRYGARCACCGETLYKALTFDHVEGGGRREKRGKGLSSKAITEGYPRRFQILCLNCNHAKADGSECPHQMIAHGLAT